MYCDGDHILHTNKCNNNNKIKNRKQFPIYYVLSLFVWVLFLRQGLMEPIWVWAHCKIVEDDPLACTSQVLRWCACAVVFRSVLSLPICCSVVLQAEGRWYWILHSKICICVQYPCPGEQHACLMCFSLLPGEIHSAEGTSNDLFFLKNERIGSSWKQKWFGPRRKAGQEEWRLRIGIVLLTEPLNLVPPDKELLWWSMLQPKAKYKPFGIYDLYLSCIISLCSWLTKNSF